MTFECEECGLEKFDEEKKEVIDGITIKNICKDCFDPSRHVEIKKHSSEEINEKLKEIYKSKKIEKPELKITKKPDDLRGRLRMERIKRGLTIKQLAELLQINPITLEKFEKGIIEDLYIRKKLIDFFGIKLINLEKFKNREGVEIDFKSNIKLSEILENENETY